jgi:L-asparaginase
MVITTTGLSPSEREAFTDIRRKGVVMVQVFPSGEHVANGFQGGGGPRPAGQGGDAQALPPTVAVQHLLPQKARILLMLALTRTRDPREVQRIFDEY